jgi:RhtB (resistance to homoserine/threonine) family protein
MTTILHYWPEFLTVASIHLLAVMSPGPDFALVLKNSLTVSRKKGIYTAIGLALGILVHVTYSLIGVGILIAKSIVIFSIIKFIGAGYLIWIGYKSLKAKPVKDREEDAELVAILSPFQAIRMGFLTNILNPKVTLFFLALFTQVVHQNTPTLVKISYGLEMSSATFIWFTILALVISHEKIKSKFTKIQHHVEHFFGAVLIALGIKVALSHAK